MSVGNGPEKLIARGRLARLDLWRAGILERSLQALHQLALGGNQAPARLSRIEPATAIDLRVCDPAARSARPLRAAFVGNDRVCVGIAFPGPGVYRLSRP